MRKTLTALTLAAALATTSVAGGCTFADAICRSGEYPVKAVGTTTGSACVPEDENPPAGYVRYPAGKVPEHVGDKWDVYWSKVIVNERGDVVPG